MTSGIRCGTRGSGLTTRCVRRPSAPRSPASELSAGVGLLDLRVIAGDAELVSGARTALLDAWRGNARKRLPELLASLDERLATFR